MSDDTHPVAPAYGVAAPAYRLPEATRVGAAHLQVSDLPRSLDYYTGVLGLRKLDASDTHATLGTHGDDPPLVILQTRPGVKRARRGAFGLFHFALLLPDRASLGRFAAYIATLDLRIGMADHLVSEALYLTDPDGLGIEVYADRPRASWRHHDRELAMTTDPLDLTDVIAAAGGRAWDGAPRGTTMGHLHLHVGTLEGAEGFYHRALGFDKMVWSYPGALFLAAGGYHHHLGTNVWSPGPAPSADDAQLLEWQLYLPSRADVAAAARSVEAAGYTTHHDAHRVTAVDPWGTRISLRAEPGTH